MLGIVCGTRPEIIKIKPLIPELEEKKIPFEIVYTNQHAYEKPELLKMFGIEESRLCVLEDLRKSEKFKNAKHRLDFLASGLLGNLSPVLDKFSVVLVQGDTSTAFFGSLSAFHLKIPIVHLEAGMRTLKINSPFPEEFYRRSISMIADVHLCPSDEQTMNLRNERVNGRVYVVGNTVLDNISDVQTSEDDVVLVTMHRRENQGERMADWFREINKTARDFSQYKFVFPIHFSPQVREYRELLDNVETVEPLNHEEFIKLLARCKIVITDSGGVQEEACFLRKKILLCRRKNEAERKDDYTFLVEEPSELVGTFEKLHKFGKNKKNSECPYGDGKSAKRCVKIIEEFLIEKQTGDFNNDKLV